MQPSETEKKIAMENLRAVVLDDLQTQKRNRKFLFGLTVIMISSLFILIFFVLWTVLHPAPATVKALEELNKLHHQLDSERVALNGREDNVIAMQQIVLQQLTEQRRIDSIRKNMRDSFFYVEPTKTKIK